MTTIDRAGLARAINPVAWKTCEERGEPKTDPVAGDAWWVEEKAESLLAADRVAAALRQPDQNGEAVGAQRWVPEDASDVMVAAALRVDWTNEDEAAVANNVWHAMVAASPQPAPEAGKLPSEEAVRAIIESAVNCAIPEPWEVVDRATKEILALLSPAQPHDEDAREDGQ